MPPFRVQKRVRKEYVHVKSCDTIFFIFRVGIAMTDSSSKYGRLYWKCRRGMLELDLILFAFLEGHYEKLSEREKQVFEILLEEEDPILQSWFTRQVVPKDKEIAAMLEFILDSVSAKGV